MNGRKLFREYAQSKGKQAKEFIDIKSEVYNNGKLEEASINYKEMIFWIIKHKKFKENDN